MSSFEKRKEQRNIFLVENEPREVELTTFLNNVETHGKPHNILTSRMVIWLLHFALIYGGVHKVSFMTAMKSN